MQSLFLKGQSSLYVDAQTPVTAPGFMPFPLPSSTAGAALLKERVWITLTLTGGDRREKYRSQNHTKCRNGGEDRKMRIGQQFSRFWPAACSHYLPW